MARLSLRGKDEVDAVQVLGDDRARRQLCSNCGKTTSSDFNLCSNCDQTSRQGYAHAAHYLHYLFLVNLTRVIWTCNGCNKSCTEIKDTLCYFCNTCKFYLCRSCFEPKKYSLHQHDLSKTDVRCVYHGSSGSWKCDCCGGNNGFGHL